MPAPESSLPPHAAWIELPDKGIHQLTGDCHIGRIEGNEIVNPDSRISRRHSVVQRQGSRFVLVDLGSTNGTYLNENRIFKPTRLKDGDVILVGSLRYTFCQPVAADDNEPDPADSAVGRTVVAVGKTSCWMLLVAPPAASDPKTVAWAGQVRETLQAGGAGIRQLPGPAFLAHWRERKISPDKVRATVLEIARQTLPAGARLALHFGAVRIGPAATPAEENLLGADVSFTHKLEAAAADLKVGFLLSEAAVLSLGLAASVSPIGVKTVRDLPGTHTLFSLKGG